MSKKIEEPSVKIVVRAPLSKMSEWLTEVDRQLGIGRSSDTQPGGLIWWKIPEQSGYTK